LPGMGLRGVVERPGQKLPVDVRLVRLDLGEQLVDEILVSFEYCHDLIVPPGFPAPSPVWAHPFRRKSRCADEGQEPDVCPSQTD
ncbi:MAG: hypothetical protein QOH16_2899, partial [Gaiellaceae bacterium]|nr:hypothetical protein [Gaiellaceae bacterium]